jgi:hypothetical protein
VQYTLSDFHFKIKGFIKVKSDLFEQKNCLILRIQRIFIECFLKRDLIMKFSQMFLLMNQYDILIFIFAFLLLIINLRIL